MESSNPNLNPYLPLSCNNLPSIENDSQKEKNRSLLEKIKHESSSISKHDIKLGQVVLKIAREKIDCPLKTKQSLVDVNAAVNNCKNYMNAFFNGKEMVYGENSSINNSRKPYFDVFINCLETTSSEVNRVERKYRDIYEGAGALDEDIPLETNLRFITYNNHCYPLRKFTQSAYEMPFLKEEDTSLQYSNKEETSTEHHPLSKNPVGIVHDGLYEHYKSLNKVMTFWCKSYSILIKNTNGPVYHQLAKIQIDLAVKEGDHETAEVLRNLWSRALNIPFSTIAERNHEEREFPEAAKPDSHRI